MSKEHVLEVLRTHSVLRAPEGKPFILKSGKESMVYVDVRISSLKPHALRVLAGELLNATIGMKTPQYVAGVALGGCPLATGVSLASFELRTQAAASRLTMGREEFLTPYPILDALYVRPEAKEHGTKNLVEGAFAKDGNVVLVEDVVTSGGSTYKAIYALRDAGLNVVGVVAVLDREEGGRKRIEDLGVPFTALVTMNELLAK